MIIATKNVRGTYSEGKLLNLADIMGEYNIDILATRETKQKDNNTNQVGDYIFFNYGDDSRILGTLFLISNRL